MTVVNRLYREIKEGILNGEYRAGTFIRETALAAQYDVSRTPIREAIRQLVSECWLEAWPNRGARVVEWTARDIDEVFELRAVLEPLIADRAARHLSGEDICRLEEFANGMECVIHVDGTDARERITHLNQLFHKTISDAAVSPRIQRVLHGIALAPVVRRSFHHYTVSELEQSMAHHRDLIRSFRAGDGEWAAAIMKAHILAARAAHVREERAEGATTAAQGNVA